MFCPNCGTKNDDSALKCSQCGFDQKPSRAAPKHMGTVMMKGSPLGAGGAPGTPARPSPNLKGTMVGVAPPDVAAPAASRATAPKKSNPLLKGTMVGVAPPGIEDLRKQAAASKAAAKSASTPAGVSSGPGGSLGTAQPASKGPPANLKGTMIGLAPPEMTAEVEAAKAKLAAKKAESAQARALSKGPPSQLKGTMIGVAPPNMKAQIAAVREAAAAQKAMADATAKAEQLPPKESTASDLTTQEDPPSEPNPLGGTMVGSTPFTAHNSPTPALGGSNARAAEMAAPADFDDNTPPAGLEVDGSFGAATRAKAVAAIAPSPAVAPAPSPVNAPPPISAPPISVGDGSVRLPVSKSSAGPILLIVLLIAIVVAGVAYLLKGGGNEGENPKEERSDERSEKSGESEPAEKATNN